MDTVGSTTNFAKQGQELTDKAADKLESGAHYVREAANQAADKASDKLESARGSAGATLD